MKILILSLILSSCASQHFVVKEKTADKGVLTYKNFNQVSEKEFYKMAKSEIHCKEAYKDVSDTPYALSGESHGELTYQCLDFRASCADGNARSCFTIGLELLAKQDANAFLVFQRACSLKDAEGCYYASLLATSSYQKRNMLENSCLLGLDRACKDQSELKLPQGAGDILADLEAIDQDFITANSGLRYKIIRQGKGKKPSTKSVVKVHYKGTLSNGEVFDSSYTRGEPVEFPLSGVIRGWTEGLQQIASGGKIELIIPPHLAYGERGVSPTIPPNATLKFEVELISVQ